MNTLSTENYIYAHREELRDSLVELCRDKIKPNYFITLAFNRRANTYTAKRNLKHFFSGIEQKTLGRHFYKTNDSRIRAIAFAEHIKSNFHYHILATVPEKYKVLFNMYAKFIWQKEVPSGDIKIDYLKQSQDVFATSSYCTKEIFKAENYQNFILATELWNVSLSSNQHGCSNTEYLSK